MDRTDATRPDAKARRNRRGRKAVRFLAGIALIVALGAAVAPRADTAIAATGSWLERGALEVRSLLLGQVRVGIQIGHLDARAHPGEHARLRVSTGGEANGVTEVEINQAVATALAERLASAGVAVDLLPASVPPRYRADAFVSLHADSSPSATRRGYKTAHFEPARTPQERVLKQLVDTAYAAGTGLPDDHENVSGNMLWYYAFDPRYRHAVSPVTPSLLIEMGYISNDRDLDLLLNPEIPAAAIAEGILAYLEHTGRLPDP